MRLSRSFFCVVGCMVPLCFPAAVLAAASGIEVLSESHRVSNTFAGSIAAAPYDESISQAYDPPVLTSQVSVSGSGSADYPPGPFGDAGRAVSRSFAGLFVVEVFTDTDLGAIEGSHSANAESQYTFMPTVESLGMRASFFGSAPTEWNSTITLRDLTDDILLANIVGAEVYGDNFPDLLLLTQRFEVDPSHVYGLSVDAVALADTEIPGGNGTVTVRLAPWEILTIPAPGALLLAALGSILAARLRRHYVL